MDSEQIKAEYAKKLKEAAKGLTNRKILKVCYNLDINPATFTRYTSGAAENVRRLEVADKIFEEITTVKAQATEEVLS